MQGYREIVEGPQRQGCDERISYQLITTAWGSNPQDPEVTAYDITNGGRVEVSEQVLTGNPAVNGDVITLPALAGLDSGRVYRLEVAFTCGDNRYEAWLEVAAED